MITEVLIFIAILTIYILSIRYNKKHDISNTHSGIATFLIIIQGASILGNVTTGSTSFPNKIINTTNAIITIGNIAYCFGYFILGIIALCIIGVPSIKQLRKKEKTINIDKTEEYDDTAVTKLVEKLEKENQEQTNTSTWHEYLERTFPNQGTRTNMQDILVQKAPTIETENTNQDINKIEEKPLPVANNIEQKVPPTPSLKKEEKKINPKTIYIILLIIETITLAVFRYYYMYR